MSRLPFELLLALRYLRPKRTFVSVITLISVLGVTLGVAVLIIVISVMSGFDQQLRETHPRLQRPPEGRPRRPLHDRLRRRSMAIIGTNRDVQGRRAVRPAARCCSKTQPEHGQSLWSSPILRGVDPAARSQRQHAATNIVDGEFDLSGRGLLVGSDFAQQHALCPSATA